MIDRAQARAAEGWRYTVFAVFQAPSGTCDAVCEWTPLDPEKVKTLNYRGRTKALRARLDRLRTAPLHAAA